MRRHNRPIAMALGALVILAVICTRDVRAGLVSEWRFDETSGTIAH